MLRSIWIKTYTNCFTFLLNKYILIYILIFDILAYSSSSSFKNIVTDGFLGFSLRDKISSILGTPRVTLLLLATPAK